MITGADKSPETLAPNLLLFSWGIRIKAAMLGLLMGTIVFVCGNWLIQPAEVAMFVVFFPSIAVVDFFAGVLPAFLVVSVLTGQRLSGMIVFALWGALTGLMCLAPFALSLMGRLYLFGSHAALLSILAGAIGGMASWRYLRWRTLPRKS